MSSLLNRYEYQATDLGYAKLKRERVVSSFVHPDIDELMGIEAQEWVLRSRRIPLETPVAGLGFSGPPLPNIELLNPPSAVTGVTAETNLYTPATTTNADWAILPQGSIRSPQAWRIHAAGTINSTGAGQTCAFTTRIGTSATPATNQSLGATGVIALGSTITAALWTYSALMTIRGPGTSATAVAHATVDISQQAAGSATTTATGKSGNTTATFDATLQQGYVISATPSAIGVGVILTQFVLVAID